MRALLKSAMIQDELAKVGVRDVRGVWAHETGGGRLLIVVSIKQRFCGHSRQAGYIAAQCQAAAYMNRFVIVVDDDVDPMNLEEVMWAVSTRCEPAEDIEIMRKSWGSKVDPLLAEPGGAVQQPGAHRRLPPVREARHVSAGRAVEPGAGAPDGRQVEGSLRRSALPAAGERDPVGRGRRGTAGVAQDRKDRLDGWTYVDSRTVVDVFFSALLQVLAPHTFGIMLVGIAVGLVVGILPGLGGAATLAMMLPFVYPMDAISAFAFLLGMHAVTATTGDITSVLFGIPGRSDVGGDGARRLSDDAARRRRAARSAPCCSARWSARCVGAAVLAVSVPVIRPVVLALGPPEFLMLTVLGLSFIVSLAGRNLVKGFIMAAFGFLLAMVGLDPQSSIQRFTFGQLYLWEGINVVPVVVGLFGGAEVLQLMMTRDSIARRGEDAADWRA